MAVLITPTRLRNHILKVMIIRHFADTLDGCGYGEQFDGFQARFELKIFPNCVLLSNYLKKNDPRRVLLLLSIEEPAHE